MAPVKLEPETPTRIPAPTDDASPGRWAVAAEPGRVGLAFRGTDEPPVNGHEVPPSIAALFGEAVLALDRDTLFGWMREGRKRFRFGVYSNGALHKTELTAPDDDGLFVGSRHHVAVATDGDTVLWDVALKDGHARKSFELAERAEIYNIMLLEDARTVVLDETSLLLVDTRDGPGRVVCRAAINANDAAGEGDRVIVLEGLGDPYGAYVLAVDGERLRLLASFEAPVDALKSHDGHVWLGVEDEWYTLTGLDAALADLAAFPEAP